MGGQHRFNTTKAKRYSIANAWLSPKNYFDT